MTSKITTLKNFLKTYIVYPITKTKAVYDDDGNRLDNILTELFQSVSSGKASVASAITDKGVTTASDAAFAVMAANIGSIATGHTSWTMVLTITAARYSGYTTGHWVYATFDSTYKCVNGNITITGTSGYTSYDSDYIATGNKVKGGVSNIVLKSFKWDD